MADEGQSLTTHRFGQRFEIICTDGITLIDLYEKHVAKLESSVKCLELLNETSVERMKPVHARITQLEARLESPGFDRFMAENGDGDREVYETLTEAREYAEQAITDWRESASSDGEWSSCVEDVTVWAAIERASEVKMEKNYPDDADSVDFVLKPLPHQDKP